MQVAVELSRSGNDLPINRCAGRIGSISYDECHEASQAEAAVTSLTSDDSDV